MSNIRPFLILCFCLFIFIGKAKIYAQAPSWQWAKSSGGNKSDQSQSIATDNEGNSYVTGFFGSSTIKFGENTLTNNLGYDGIFIVKYDPQGIVLWAKSAVGSFGSIDGQDLTVDANGNLYITGYFGSEELRFGELTLTNSGGGSMFIIKLDPDGSPLWGRTANGNDIEVGTAVTTDASGNVYVSGYTTSTAISFGTTTLTSKGEADIFIVKYDTFGEVLWATSIGGESNEIPGGIVADASGNLYVTGSFGSSEIQPGSEKLTNKNQQGIGSFDMFVVKYSPSGSVIWAVSGGGRSQDFGHDVALDKTGNVVTTGSVGVINGVFGDFTLDSDGPDDVFAVKYSAGNGAALWAYNYGGPGKESGQKIETDSSGNIYIAGEFLGSYIKFGDFTISEDNLSDGFIVKIAENGTVIWAEGVTGNSDEHIGGLALDRFGDVLITGFSDSDELNFGTISVKSDTTTDMFIAKLGNKATSAVLSPIQKKRAIIQSQKDYGIFLVSGVDTGIWNVRIWSLDGCEIYNTVYNGERFLH